jgi:hypothetical protein
MTAASTILVRHVQEEAPILEQVRGNAAAF